MLVLYGAILRELLVIAATNEIPQGYLTKLDTVCEGARTSNLPLRLVSGDLMITVECLCC